METMKQIFRSDSSEELPLLEERMTNLHQSARVLNEVCGCVGVWVWDVGRSSYDLSKLALKTGPFQKRKPHLIIAHNFFQGIGGSVQRAVCVCMLRRAQFLLECAYSVILSVSPRKSGAPGGEMFGTN